MNIVVDSEFRGLIPPLTKEEYDGLAASIVADGCRDAIVLWGDVIVDGHNRYEICMAHDIPFQTVQKEFASRDDVKLWMMKNQLARRNLNDFQRIEIVSKCEDAVRERQKKGKRHQRAVQRHSLWKYFPKLKKAHRVHVMNLAQWPVCLVRLMNMP